MKKLLTFAFALCFSLSSRADEGMWLLTQLGVNIETMQKMGLKLGETDIYSVDKPSIKDAIVGLGNEGRPFAHFCSGEIISPEGLLLTNHHCGFESIQSHSSVEHNYLADGFWALDKKQELTNPGITASILDHMENVTERFNTVLNDKMSVERRHQVIDSISKVVMQEAVKGTKFSAQIQPMFEDNQFYLLVYTVYRDVRLVAAPPQSLGKFGGDTDNWIWPRHTADFSMFRIYTAPDGSPAPYSANNVPLKPKHFLPISAKGIQDNDFAMIFGFPGTTNRFVTSYGLENVMQNNAIRHDARTEVLDVMMKEMKKDEKTRIQYASKYAGIANYWKYSDEQNKALVNLNTMGAKQAIEAEFTNWVQQSPARVAMYGNVLSTMKNDYAQLKPEEKLSTYFMEALLAPETPKMLFKMGKMYEEYAAGTLSNDKKAQYKRAIEETNKEFYKDFNPIVERNLFARLFAYYAENVAKESRPDIFAFIDKQYKGNYSRFADDVLKRSIFLDEARIDAFLAAPNKKVLEKDLVYKTFKSFVSYYMGMRTQTAGSDVQLAQLRRLFVRGLMEMKNDKVWAPDANSTIRMTYGRVRSYKPRDAVYYDYYTTMTGVIEKEGPKGGEFEVPGRLKELYAAKDFAPYGSENVATCFITDNDITGGNSGSGVINANGELIGTAFDGNSEAMSGDIDFEENLQRCINLDARYMLWIVDKYAGAKNLINEMKIVF